MRSLKKRGPHVLDDLMTSYFPYSTSVWFLNVVKVKIRKLAMALSASALQSRKWQPPLPFLTVKLQISLCGYPLLTPWYKMQRYHALN